jgi:hypothetical protein
MNIQVSNGTNFSAGNLARRDSSRAGENVTSDRMRLSQRANSSNNRNSLQALVQESPCKVDDSLLEINTLRQGFLRRLMGDEKTEPQSFEQLHSEIMENYKDEERDKRIAVLEVASNSVNALREQASLHSEMLSRRGDMTIDEGILQLSFSNSFRAFMETGVITTGDNMEDYSRFDTDSMRDWLAHNIATFAFFGEYHGDGESSVRSLDEMARLFEDRMEALRNATNISEQRREIEMEALTRGFVKAVEMRLIGTSGASADLGTDSRFTSSEAITQFAIDSTEKIRQMGVGEEVQALLFQGLSNVVLNQSSILSMIEFSEVHERVLILTQYESSEAWWQAWHSLQDFADTLHARHQRFEDLLAALFQEIS